MDSFRPNENRSSDSRSSDSRSGENSNFSSQGEPSSDSSADSFVLIRARCPNCHKLYSVEAAQITVPEPRFECVSCYARFAFHFPLAEGEVFAPTYLFEENVPPFPVVASQAPFVAETPMEEGRAGTPVSSSAQTSVRVPFSKPVNQLAFKGESTKTESEKLVNEINFGGTPDLVAAWKKVLANYESEDGHNKFIFACFEANCLTYASHKYAHILGSRPDDEMAKRMRKRIIALASTKSLASRKQEPLFRVPRLNSLVILIGATVMFIGFLVPSLRNMAGFGASMIALAVGLRIFLK